MEPTIYRVDEKDIIYYVNDAWREFAKENGNNHLEEKVIGNEIWNFIQDEAIKNLYSRIMQNVRQTQKPFNFNSRCDAPDIKREVIMSLKPLPNNHIEFQNSITQEIKRDPISIFTWTFTRSHNAIRICSWCHSVYMKDAWIELENASEIIRDFTSEFHKEITHGICENCLVKMNALIDQMN